MIRHIKSRNRQPNPQTWLEKSVEHANDPMAGMEREGRTILRMGSTVLVPAQFFTKECHSENERRFLYAILERAISDADMLVRGKSIPSHMENMDNENREKLAYLDTLNWMREPGDGSLHSWRGLCEALDLDADAILKAILRRAPKRPKKRKGKRKGRARMRVVK